MEPSAVYDRDARRERMLRARRSTPGERMLHGAQLFDAGIETMMGMLRTMHPAATEEELLLIVRQKLARYRRRQTP